MKLLLSTCLFMVLAYSVSATTYVLNNSEDRPSEHYDNFNDIQNIASAEDTVLVNGYDGYASGNGQHYDAITITKPLTLIGTGYLLNRLADSLTINDFESVFSSITIDTLANGTSLLGISSNQSIIVMASGVTLMGCQIKTSNFRLQLQPSSNPNASNYVINNTVIANCVLPEINIWPRCTNLLIRNNIITYIQGPGSVQESSTLIDHNTFVGYRSSSRGLRDVANSVVSSNIFSQGLFTNYASDAQSNSFSFNLSTEADLPNNNGNLINQDCSNIFIAINACN